MDINLVIAKKTLSQVGVFLLKKAALMMSPLAVDGRWRLINFVDEMSICVPFVYLNYFFLLICVHFHSLYCLPHILSDLLSLTRINFLN